MDERAQPDVVAASEVSRLLLAWSGGDQCALEKLAPIVYDELRRLAHRYMRRERPGHSLRSTALVTKRTSGWWIISAWIGRAAPISFSVAAQAMRRILVEHARRKNQKRGGGVQRILRR
jgi:RNA polymerase sigma-70 factor, ECF subfamily